uniref:Uncharacterized protein n=1 Tax=Manihot esculenta TaxID=3983 RepID=A0A199UC47_MANES
MMITKVCICYHFVGFDHSISVNYYFIMEMLQDSRHLHFSFFSWQLYFLHACWLCIFFIVMIILISIR